MPTYLHLIPSHTRTVKTIHGGSQTKQDALRTSVQVTNHPLDEHGREGDDGLREHQHGRHVEPKDADEVLAIVHQGDGAHGDCLPRNTRAAALGNGHRVCHHAWRVFFVQEPSLQRCHTLFYNWVPCRVGKLRNNFTFDSTQEISKRAPRPRIDHDYRKASGMRI